jgi:hypothetical protein
MSTLARFRIGDRVVARMHGPYFGQECFGIVTQEASKRVDGVDYPVAYAGVKFDKLGFPCWYIEPRDLEHSFEP